MNKLFTLSFLLFGTSVLRAQSIGIGTANPSSSAQLDITSTTQGLLIPRMDSTTIGHISNPANGLLVYDSSRNQLYVNTGSATYPNWQNIVAGSGWSLTGNSGFYPNAVIGTNDYPTLKFVAGGQPSGIIDHDFQNVVFGSSAYQASSNGPAGNTVMGSNALVSNSGSQNSAFGYTAASSLTSGQYNTIMGADALQANSTGNYNTGMGAFALGANRASNNVAIGYYALEGDGAGSDNTACGYYAASNNTTGQYNVGVGEDALVANQTGSSNTAIGTFTLYNNTSDYNTAIGYQALSNTTASQYNTALGYNAGQLHDNGYNNVFLGANTDVNAAGYFNVVAIGQGVICTASSQARIGNSATSSIGGYAAWTNFSDGRYKKNRKENVKGLDFILKLRPITYNLDVTGINAHLGAKSAKDAGTQQAIRDREAAVLSGFSAQEVDQAAAAAGYDFSGVDKPKNANDFYGLRYSDFVVPLVKAIQEQQAMIKDLQQQVADLKKQIKP